MRVLLASPANAAAGCFTCLVVAQDNHVQTVSCAGLCLNAWLVCGKKV